MSERLCACGCGVKIAEPKLPCADLRRQTETENHERFKQAYSIVACEVKDALRPKLFTEMNIIPCSYGRKRSVEADA